MERQLTPGNHVLAIDLASCIRCGNCVSACEQTHDDHLPRFFWDHLRTDEDLLPEVRISSSCQHCEYPLCSSNCPTDAIQADTASGAVFIDYDKCIRCGKCSPRRSTRIATCDPSGTRSCSASTAMPFSA